MKKVNWSHRYYGKKKNALTLSGHLWFVSTNNGHYTFAWFPYFSIETQKGIFINFSKGNCWQKKKPEF